jgi:hypothetical protein
VTRTAVAIEQLSKHIIAEANARNNVRALSSVVRAAVVAAQWCGEHISAAVNQHATITEVVISEGAAPRQYNETLRQLRELRESGDDNRRRLIRNYKKKIRLCKDFVCVAVTMRLL